MLNVLMGTEQFFFSENAQQSHFKIVLKTAFPFANSYTDLISTGDGCCHKAAVPNM